MNERIKELLAQAYDQAVPETWTTLSSEQLERVYEKFAQLIVQECANLFEVEWGEEKLTGNDVGYVVKKHFGINNN